MDFSLGGYAGLDSNTLPMSNFGGDALGQEYSLLQSTLIDGAPHFGVSTIAFDEYEELLWIGNHGGHITSYSSPEIVRYTSFDVHVGHEVRGLLSHNDFILSLTSSLLRTSIRRGLTVHSYCSENMQNMQCMILTPANTLLLGGHHRNLIEFHLERQEELRVIQVNGDNCAILRKSPRYICSGDTNGKIYLYDPSNLSLEHVIDSHSGMLSDFDVLGNQLVTCGYSAGRHSELTVDMFLKLYDLRMMKSMKPIQLSFLPLLLRFVPAYSSRLCVVSQTGRFEMVNTDNINQMSYMHQMDSQGEILTFDISVSCQALAFGDSAGYLHVYGTSGEVQFNQFSRPIEFADPVEAFHPIDINDELTPLSSIPFPRVEGKLISDWPEQFSQPAYRPTPPVDPQILLSMKLDRSIGYAPNPGNRLRNQVPYHLNDNKLSNSSQETQSNKDGSQEIIPYRYLKPEMKYIRAPDESEFSKYNRTCFSGLEANLPNSYCNNMIQILYFIEPLRSALLNHLCQREFCLSCELGFLFHMLDSAEGLPCQASNFLRAFRTIREASAHNLLITDLSEVKKKRGNLQNLVQSWTRFILQQIHTETVAASPITEEQKYSEHDSDSVTNSLFGTRLFTNNSCRCKIETCQETVVLTVQLLYPDYSPEESIRKFSFAEIVQRNLSPKHQINAYCETCKRFTSMIQTKFPKKLPEILVLCCGDNKKDILFWETQLQLLEESGEKSVMKTLPEVPALRKKHCRYGDLCKRTDCRYYHEQKIKTGNGNDPPNQSTSWIPFGLKVRLSGSELTVKECDPHNAQVTENDLPVDNAEASETVIYELIAIVSVILDNQDNGKDNIVSCIKVGPVHHNRHKGSSLSHWYLFNDFSIVPITQEEAVYLNFEWKLPSVLYFSRIDLNTRHNTEVYKQVEEQVFREDVSLAAGSGRSHVTFTPLTMNDRPSAGQLVAMDAEFVTLNQEEAEIRSDGTRSMIRPSQKSVARISCVRGEGSLAGTPFIDDYISTPEQVVDYLTKFSGIQPGDLDASISSKHLTTLKATYQKLRFLIDTGVKFVGHGLKNDFRVINLVVPPEQVIDTVYLFQLPNQRMISLQFLAWHFLDLKIQTKTHDSIEDARTALQLYKKYQELKSTGELNDALKKLYEVGRTLQWKVPGIDKK